MLPADSEGPDELRPDREHGPAGLHAPGQVNENRTQETLFKAQNKAIDERNNGGSINYRV